MTAASPQPASAGNPCSARSRAASASPITSFSPQSAFLKNNTIAPQKTLGYGSDEVEKMNKGNQKVRAWQGELFGSIPLEYGGEKSRGKRKSMRPFDRKRAIHATFRASKAIGAWSMLNRRHKGYVYGETDRIATESRGKLYR